MMQGSFRESSWPIDLFGLPVLISIAPTTFAVLLPALFPPILKSWRASFILPLVPSVTFSFLQSGPF